MKRYLPFVIIAGVLVVALVGGMALLRSSREAQKTTPPFTNPSPGTTPAATQQTPQARTTPPAGPDNPHFRGGANAKVVVEEYGDYQCPSCGALFHELKIIEKDYGDQIRFVFRQYPLEGHKHAMIAARAAEAAALQGKFWEMHDIIYQNQLNWTVAEDARPIFIQYAQLLNLDVPRFTRDLDNPEVAARVDADSQRGKAAGVQGTPTLYINGRELKPEMMTDQGLRAALDYMLGKKK